MKILGIAVTWLIVLIIFGLLFIPAQAEKPKSTEYPAPNTFLFESEAYPLPTPLVPTQVPTLMDQLYANEPLADPRPGIPYVWGEFTVVHYDQMLHQNVALRAIWVTIDNIGFQPELEGLVIVANDDFDSKTGTLYFYDYDAGNDVNLYYSRVTMCDVKFFIWYATLNNIAADIRQPNDYFNRCVFLPGPFKE